MGEKSGSALGGGGVEVPSSVLWQLYFSPCPPFLFMSAISIAFYALQQSNFRRRHSSLKKRESAKKSRFFLLCIGRTFPGFSRFFFSFCMALKKFTKCFVKETKTLQRSRGCRCWQWSANCSAKCPPANLSASLSISIYPSLSPCFYLHIPISL